MNRIWREERKEREGMKRLIKNLSILTAVLWLTSLFPGAVFAYDGEAVRDFPGFNGSDSGFTGPYEGESYDCWEDYDDGDDDSDQYERGWRYSPAGWWFQYRDGSWPSNGWTYIDGRWYQFDQGGHMVTGWFKDSQGFWYYLNPVDDGTLGSMRTGWQVVDGKAYYFNTMSDGFKGRLLINTVTPDGYSVGADGALFLS